MDPTNHKANAHLEALEKHSTNTPLVESSFDQTGASTSAELENAVEDEVMEVQQEPESVERLPSIEEEGETEGWADVVDVQTERSNTADTAEPTEQGDTTESAND